MPRHPSYKTDSFKHEDRTVFRQWRLVYDEGLPGTLETDISVRGVRANCLDAYCYRTATWRLFDPRRIHAILNLKTGRKMKSFKARYGVDTGDQSLYSDQ